MSNKSRVSFSRYKLVSVSCVKVLFVTACGLGNCLYKLKSIEECIACLKPTLSTRKSNSVVKVLSIKTGRRI
ncbi:hypothetical protein V1512DRAFT_256844 [Lipomyces arxii]|uniref:uncharacterized protein n=1 Tax=Lipomyces arxii TaxID=56418 RepID=UPI0034CF60C1